MHMIEASEKTISVVIPTYNCAALLPRAIRSAYAQTLPPSEVVVVNDGSTDETAEVLGKLASELPASFVFENRANGGEASARNRGVALASSEYVAFLDQDDVWAPDKLERQMELFLRDPQLALTFTAYNRIGESEQSVVRVHGWEPSPEHALRELLNGCCITPSTVVVRRDILAEIGPFDESLWLGCDWTMWLEIAAAGHRIGYEPEPLTDYFVHETNMSRDLRRIAQAALVIFPRLFGSGRLPASIQGLERECYARWHMISAIYSLSGGDGRAARRELLEAVRARPLSARPGWLGIYVRSFFPGHGEARVG